MTPCLEAAYAGTVIPPTNGIRTYFLNDNGVQLALKRHQTGDVDNFPPRSGIDGTLRNWCFSSNPSARSQHMPPAVSCKSPHGVQVNLKNLMQCNFVETVPEWGHGHTSFQSSSEKFSAGFL